MSSAPRLVLSLTLGLLVAAAGAGPGRAVAAGQRPAASRKAQGRAAKKPVRRSGRGRKPAVVHERRVPWLKNNLPNVQALGALVIDLDSRQELFGRKPDQPRPIASISKLAAALVVADKGLPLDELTTIKKVDAEVARGGAPSRLLEGMTLTNRDLLHAALLGSDNRAVSALGRAVGLSSSQLAAAMTKRAQSLGLKQTRFLEPTGLSPENVSTPREAIVMLEAAMAHPLLAPVVNRPEYDAHPVARPAIKYVTTHKPAARSNTQVLGGKTGYNDAARYCLVLAARVDGRRLGMAFLGTEGKLTRFGDVARVADWVVVHKPKAPAPSAVAAGGRPDNGAPLGPDPAASAAPPGALPPAAIPTAVQAAGEAPKL